MRKKGISLIVLTITLIVMSILAFATIISLNNSTDAAKAAGFAAELKEIIEGVQAYYLQYKELPIVKDKSYTQTSLLTISNDSQELQNEFDINRDTSQTYYEIDLSKISQSGSLYGNNNILNDVYVVSEDCNFVYYPLGVKISDNIYFSLTSKLAQITDIEIPDSIPGDVVSAITASKISVSKSTEDWTNTLELAISTTLNVGEKLYYVVGSVKSQITENLPYTLELSNNTIASNSTLASEITESEYIVLQKENSEGKIIAKTTVGIKNLDIYPPVIGIPIVKKVSDGDTFVYISVEFAEATDEKSGIKASYYTTGTEGTPQEIVAAGNMGGKYSIKLAEDSSLKFVLVDNAGNITAVQELDI